MIDKLLANLEDIDDFIDKSPNLKTFKSEDDFMDYQVQLMNLTLYLLKVSCALSPDETIASHDML